MKILYSVLRTLFLAFIFTYGLLYVKLLIDTPSGNERPQMASVANG